MTSNFSSALKLAFHFQFNSKLWAGSCRSELQLKVNCKIEFGLGRPPVGRPVQILFYNSLSVYNSISAAIHLYVIHPLKVCLSQPISIIEEQNILLILLWRILSTPLISLMENSLHTLISIQNTSKTVQRKLKNALCYVRLIDLFPVKNFSIKKTFNRFISPSLKSFSS